MSAHPLRAQPHPSNKASPACPSCPGVRPRGASNALTRDEIDRGLRLSEFPAVLTVREAAALLRLSESALYHRIGRGEFRSAINGRGKPMRFWRDRLVKEFFGPRSRNHSTSRGGEAGGGNGGWR